MRRFATATIVGVAALSQSAHTADAYPRNAEELVAAQAQLDAIKAEALIFQIDDRFRGRLNAPLNRRNSELRPSRDRIVPVSASLAARNDRIGNSVATEALRLDVGALISAGTDRSDAGKADEKFFSLVIEGSEYVLDVVEVMFDPIFSMQHVLAAVVNTTPDAYARFTFDPKSGSIAGTVASGGQRYRIVSSNDRGAQLVFRLESAQTDSGGLVTSEKLAAASVAQVERRHAQAERIAEIKPEISVHGKNGFSTILLGGAIGKVDVARLGEPQVIAQLLKDLSVFTTATGDEEFEILSVGRMDDQGRRRVAFRQLIGGIPVDFRSKLEVGPNGDVWHLITQVVDPSGAPTNLIGRQEALKIATEEIERVVGHLGIVKIDWMSNVGLEFVAKPTSQEEYGIALTPTWRVPALVTTLNGSRSGESAVVILSTPQPARLIYS